MKGLLLIKPTLNRFITLFFIGAVTSVTAHTYFFGVSDLSINAKSQHIEIIHQFTAHDIENAIAQIQNTHFSPEHPQYDTYIKNYFDQNFQLQKDQKTIKLTWIGFEVKLGKLIAYQESVQKITLKNLVVINTLLVDIYNKQLNTVNFQYQGIQKSLTFTQSQRMHKIFNKQ